MSLKKLDTLTISANTSIYHTSDIDSESIDSIIDKSYWESDIGSRISDSATELFTMDDDT